MKSYQNLTLWHRIYFMLHHSIFLQMTLLFTCVSIVLGILHCKLRKMYNDKLNELIIGNERIEKLEADGSNLKLNTNGKNIFFIIF
jgi:hypothetical protein